MVVLFIAQNIEIIEITKFAVLIKSTLEYDFNNML